jgi:hypothetical protein
MLTVAQANRRARWYTGLAFLGAGLFVAYFALGGLKYLCTLTESYGTWSRPFAKLGWLVQWVGWHAANMRVIGAVWPHIPALNGPWVFLQMPGAFMIVLLAVSVVMHRAASSIRQDLREVLRQLQQEKWRRELDQDGRRDSAPLARQIQIYKDAPVMPMPWWTRPLGLIAIAVVGGVLAGVGTQALNLWLGLAR